MSGGYLNEKGLNPGEHEVVIFTFTGPISAAKCIRWNVAIRAEKKRIGANGVMGATMDAKETPGPKAFGKKGVDVMGATIQGRKKRPGPKAFGKKAPKK